MSRSLPAPSPAERARSIVARAASLTVLTDTYRAHLEGRHAVCADGDILLTLPEDAAVLAEVRATDGLGVVLEFTDIAPISVRDRVRARLSLSGWLEAVPSPQVGEPRVRLTPVAVALDTMGRSLDIEPEDYVAAEPDPYAAQEAAILAHLLAEHRHELDQMLTRCEPGLDGRRRTLPLALDRHGLTLRVERSSGWCDVRVSLAACLSSPTVVP